MARRRRSRCSRCAWLYRVSASVTASTKDGPLLGGRWRLGPRLGKGAQAETYLAIEVARRQEVVVKRVRLGAGWKSFELHEREAKVLGQLRHAGIPRLYGALEEPPGVFN